MQLLDDVNYAGYITSGPPNPSIEMNFMTSVLFIFCLLESLGLFSRQLKCRDLRPFWLHGYTSLCKKYILLTAVLDHLKNSGLACKSDL